MKKGFKQMINVRKSSARGHITSDWLDTYHTFSFDEYYDSKFMHFSNLRVINEDYIKANSGFSTHSHNNMEIMTYIISGELTHKDSMGNSSTIKSNEIQFMRAGKGVTHSEFNPSQTTTHLLQIWILPKEKDLLPAYDQRLYSKQDKLGKLCKIASATGNNGEFKIAQDVTIFTSLLTKQDMPIDYLIVNGHHIWVQVVTGSLTLNDKILTAGDGAGIYDEEALHIAGTDHAEFLLFDFS